MPGKDRERSTCDHVASNHTQPQDQGSGDSLIGCLHRNRLQAPQGHVPHLKLTICLPPSKPGSAMWVLGRSERCHQNPWSHTCSSVSLPPGAPLGWAAPGRGKGRTGQRCMLAVLQTQKQPWGAPGERPLWPPRSVPGCEGHILPGRALGRWWGVADSPARRGTSPFLSGCAHIPPCPLQYSESLFHLLPKYFLTQSALSPLSRLSRGLWCHRHTLASPSE